MSSSTDRTDHVKNRGSVKLNQRPSLKEKSAPVEQDEENKFKVHASAFRGLARAANVLGYTHATHRFQIFHFLILELRSLNLEYLCHVSFL